MIETAHFPNPDVLAIPSYETILADNVALLKQFIPDYQPLESDPYLLLLEAFAYRELHLHQQINNKVRAMLLPFSTGNDLDTIAVFYGVERLEGEQDQAFRDRILRSLDGFSTAGSIESYQYHAYSVDSRIDDVNAFSPVKGEVVVAITSFNDLSDHDPEVDPAIEMNALVSRVAEKLNQSKVRPITDHVSVVAARAKYETITAEVVLLNSNDKQSIQSTIENHFNQQLTIGQNLTHSQMIRYLHVEGVYKAVLTSHNADINCQPDEIIKIASIDIDYQPIAQGDQ